MGRALDVAVVIPAFHPPADLDALVDGLVAEGFTGILVVDDGSGPDHRPLFDAVAARPGVTVLRHAVNRGKGAALKTAFDHLLSTDRAWAGVVTCDADGQHRPADVAEVARALVDAPADEPPSVVLGVRRLDAAGVPRRGRVATSITSTIVGVLTGQRIPDTQTGLRAFPWSLLPFLLTVRGAREEYEMNVLLSLANRRVPLLSTPVEAHYRADTHKSLATAVAGYTRIYGILLRQFLTFIGSSVLATLLDLGIYSLIMWAVFHSSHAAGAIGVAATTARVMSSLSNYAVNRFLIFRESESDNRSLVRYYILAAGILIASITLTSLLARAFGGHVVYAKIIGDSLLFLVSYVVQKRWVFRDSVPNEQEN